MVDFTLRVFGDTDNHRYVQLLAWPDGPQGPQHEYPAQRIIHHPREDDIRRWRHCLAQGISTAGSSHQCAEARSHSTLEAMQSLGNELRRMLFPPVVWRQFLGQLREAKSRLWLRLLIEPRSLMVWPFEYLYVKEWERLDEFASEQSGFLSLHSNIALVRLSSLGGARLWPAPMRELRVMVVCSDISSDGQIAVRNHGRTYEMRSWDTLPYLTKEFDLVQETLKQVEGDQPVIVESLVNPTPADLKAKLHCVSKYHAVVYLGHAYDNSARVAGRYSDCGLVLNDGKGGPAYLAAGTLGQILEGSEVRLLILNACETMKAALALDLAMQGLVTVAMHFAQPDFAGMLFGYDFWKAVARRASIPDSLAEARMALVHSFTENRPEWGNAAVIMHPQQDGELFADPEEMTRQRRMDYLRRRYGP